MISPRSLLATSLAISASLAWAAPTTTSAAQPICTPESDQGIVQPANSATITQINDGSFSGTTFEVLYCSEQYFKTSSVAASVLLNVPESPNNGELLVRDVAPDNLDASAGFYSYRFNVTISPSDGDYPTGLYSLSIYETTTGTSKCPDFRAKLTERSGYYNPYDFQITSINVTLAVGGS